MKTELNEQDIKAAVIEKLRSRLLNQDAVLINEMVFSGRDRRADLVIANGHIQAFEIKSDLDTLRRLSGQVDDYLEKFDKLTLVVSSRYLEDALSTDERVGVWEAVKKKESIEIRIRRAGKISSVSCAPTLCEFMLKSELVSFLRSKKVIADFRRISREELVGLCSSFPSSTVRKSAIACIKSRYSDLSSAFLESNTGAIEPAAIAGLSKSKVRRKRLEEELGWGTVRATEKSREINLSRFFPDGDIPDSIPRRILVPQS